MTISGKKILRDVFIIAVIAIGGLVILNYIPLGHQHSPDCIHNQPSGSFQLDSDAPILKIEDEPAITLGEIDYHVIKDLEMRAIDEHEIDDQLLITYRVTAISRLIQDYINRQVALDYGLTVSEEEIDSEFETVYIRHGGKDEFLSIMKNMNLDEQAFHRLITKNILEDKILRAVTDNLELPHDIQWSDELRVQEYLKWLNSKTDELDIVIMDPVLNHAYEMATSSTQRVSAPAGMSGNEMRMVDNAESEIADSEETNSQ